ncbi:hypothetical protein D3C73_1618010 [compost metagenome]
MGVKSDEHVISSCYEVPRVSLDLGALRYQRPHVLNGSLDVVQLFPIANGVQSSKQTLRDGVEREAVKY